MLADVIVDLEVWALDRSLTYLVPEALAGRLTVGSIVRVPLRGRRVRGWVVDLRDGEPPEGAQPLLAASGRAPVFDRPLLAAAAELARRYVHPLAAFLHVITPPRLGRARAGGGPAGPGPPGAAPAPRLWRIGPADDPSDRYAQEIAGALERGRGAIVAVPEVREGSRILSRLEEAFAGEAAVAHSGIDPAARAAALWSVALGDRRVLLGSRASVLAPAFPASSPVGVIIVHQEHDRSFKEQRAPYYHAREAALVRSARTGAAALLASSTPSLVSLRLAEAGWAIEEDPRPVQRAAWPIVEVVEPAAAGLPRRVVAAVLEARHRGERVLVLLPRARATPAGLGPEEVARHLSRVVPGARITRGDRPTMGAPGALEEVLKGDVVVATEAALAEIEHPAVSTAVALGADAFLGRPAGRAVEEAFAALWRLARLVAGGSRRGRLLLETRTPDHPVVQALTRGDYHYFARHELAERRLTRSPPFCTLIRVQIAGPEPEPEALARLRELPGTEMLGPTAGRLGHELLLKVEDLEEVEGPLREVVSSAAGRMLVEVDPRDW